MTNPYNCTEQEDPTKERILTFLKKVGAIFKAKHCNYCQGSCGGLCESGEKIRKEIRKNWKWK